ncbi:MAG: 50S ribosomal protein L4 [Chloroflexota bacterium]|nr:50S ribosomal protein L4 [Chloroflexota bacterium]MDE2893928.1 50S ribosomal protein L4 [Chloroflexota bacterium]
MKLPLIDAQGNAAGEIDADDSVFGIEPNLAVVHQAVTAQQANARQGNASTLDRSGIRQASKKTGRQKGGGRARMGTPSSPTRIGGAVAHGPHTRSYRQRLPKRMRRLAIRSVLSQRAAEGGVLVAAPDVEFEPRTSAMSNLCQAMGVERSALVVSDGVDEALVRGTQNLPNVQATPAQTLNTYLILTHDQLIMTEAAVRRCEALWALPGEEDGDA